MRSAGAAATRRGKRGHDGGVVTSEAAVADATAGSPALALPLVHAAAIEFVATGFLLIAIVGSGIMAERLFGGNVGLALLANAVATGGALVALILAFGPQSGAHMNPMVTLAAVLADGFAWRLALAYVAAQLAGAAIGVALAHLMFEMPVWQVSHHVRSGAGQFIAEMVATFGLLTVIWGCRAHRQPVTAFAVGAYITGAYWFTASTSFANPAVTMARALTDSFAGIRPDDVPGFILAQFAALALALPLLRRRG
jgi:glycerol uptake facilitator-like aquaporin